MLWDLYCRVIDNHGDAGVCWRLAADLAARGEQVRLWIDDARALDWMAPGGARGVQVHDWPTGELAPQVMAPPEVVVEAFGCELPDAVVASMAAQHRRPVWINLEYLSAEDYVQASHGLRSPQFSGPGVGLDKWFFYPGFTPDTGGLLREQDLGARQATFDGAAWLAGQGWSPAQGERVVTLFCYDNPRCPELLQWLSPHPTLLLVCPGPIRPRVDALALPESIRRIDLPWLPQPEFDHLLWSADLNFVRGEDSAARAMWAGRPFVWQTYPQHDLAHATKLDAFTRRMATSIDHGSEYEAWRRWLGVQSAWNGLAPWPDPMPDPAALQPMFQAWRGHLLEQPDLTTQLLKFVNEKR